MTQRMNVESFNLDHRTVVAPYVRLADRKHLPHGDVISKYDVRFTQPNVAHLEMDTVHSLEHLFAELSRNHSDAVIDFSPMGCQTGFYLMLAGEPSDDQSASWSRPPCATSSRRRRCPPPTRCSAAGARTTP